MTATEIPAPSTGSTHPGLATSPIRSAFSPRRLAALSILSMLIASGCGNDASSSGAAGTNGAGGDGVAPFSGAVLCSNVFSEPRTGFARLVSDEELETGEEIEGVQGAIEVGGGIDCVVRDRSVFAFSLESPTATRYDEVDGALVEGETVSFANFGLTSMQGESVIVSDTDAYFVDTTSLQVILWNPSAMETVRSISLPVPPELPAGLRLIGINSLLVDDLLVIYSRYFTEQDVYAPLTDFWFFSTATGEVVATDVSECGALNYDGRVGFATNGDVYFGSRTRTVAEHALGLPGAPSPCAIRIRAGATEVDPNYFADLNALNGGLPTAALMYPAGEDRVFLVAYDSNTLPIDPNLTARELAALTNWNLYEWELGTEGPMTRVETFPTGIGFLDLRTYEGTGTTYAAVVAPDFSWTELVDVTKNPVETVFRFTNYVNLFARLGNERDAQMAQRIEPRGGLSVSPL